MDLKTPFGEMVIYRNYDGHGKETGEAVVFHKDEFDEQLCEQARPHRNWAKPSSVAKVYRQKYNPLAVSKKRHNEKWKAEFAFCHNLEKRLNAALGKPPTLKTSAEIQARAMYERQRREMYLKGQLQQRTQQATPRIEVTGPSTIAPPSTQTSTTNNTTPFLAASPANNNHLTPTRHQLYMPPTPQSQLQPRQVQNTPGTAVRAAPSNSNSSRAGKVAAHRAELERIAAMYKGVAASTSAVSGLPSGWMPSSVNGGHRPKPVAK